MKITFKVPNKKNIDIDRKYEVTRTNKVKRWFLYSFWPVSRKLIKRLPIKYRRTKYTLEIHSDDKK